MNEIYKERVLGVENNLYEMYFKKIYINVKNDI